MRNILGGGKVECKELKARKLIMFLGLPDPSCGQEIAIQCIPSAIGKHWRVLPLERHDPIRFHEENYCCLNLWNN